MRTWAVRVPIKFVRPLQRQEKIHLRKELLLQTGYATTTQLMGGGGRGCYIMEVQVEGGWPGEAVEKIVKIVNGVVKAIQDLPPWHIQRNRINLTSPPRRSYRVDCGPVRPQTDAPYCMQCGVQMLSAGSGYAHACPSCGTTSGF